MIRSSQALSRDFGCDRGQVCPGRQAAGRHAHFRRNPGALKSRKDRRIVVFDQDRSRSEIPMNYWLIARSCFVHFLQSPSGIACKRESAACSPRGVSHAVFKSRRCWIDDRKEEHFPRVSGCVLIGIENPRRPGMKLQAVKRFGFAHRFGFSILVIARG